MRMLILSCSLSDRSRSRVLAQRAREVLEADATVNFMDLRDYPLPLCNGKTPDDPNLEALKTAITEADAILLATPIYNYDVSAAAKNMVEQTSRAWTEKTVAFVCAAGGGGSYMSVMPFANSLMLDFRCLVVPRFVYTTGAAFDETLQLTDERIRERCDELCTEMLRLTRALK